MAQNEPEWKQELARKKKLEADKKIIEKIQKRPIHVYTIDLYHIYSDWWLQTVKQYGDYIK